MAVAHSYLRFSSKQQAFGDSKRRQRERSDEWIKRNGHTLSSLRFEDLGVSAFRGKNRHTGALQRFLKAIEEGTVKPGEILIVENLDRLSREGVSEAFSLFNDILRAGVSIAVLTPTERIYTKKSINDLVGLIEPLMSFHLGWEESQKKSDRLGKVWQEKRKQAQDCRTPLNRKCPSWLEWNEAKGRFVKKPAGAAAIRHIFQRTVDGIGQRAVIRELTEKFRPIGLSGHWNSSFIQKVLNDRAVLGEFQPKSFDQNGDRIPQGKPIADYYPRIIEDGLWYRAQAAKATRLKHKGPNSDFFSLFSGLVFNARDGHPCHVGTTRNYQFKGNPIKRPKQRRLYSYGHLRKLKGACPLSFDYYLFEAACLQFLSELRAADLLPQSVNRNESTIIENEAELAGVEGRLNALKRQLEDPETSLPTVLEVVGKLEKKRVELRNQIDRLKREAATHEENPISQAQTILELLKAADDAKKRELRTKLRVVIPSIVESIYVVPLKQPKRQVFFTVQINLKNGGIKQIFCTNKQFCGTRREALQTVSLDLRKPADVQRLLKKPVPAVA